MNLLQFWRKFRSPKTLEERLTRSLGKPVHLEISEGGTQRIFSMPQSDGSLKVRLDALFEGIGKEDYRNLESYLREGDEKSKAKVIEFLSRSAEGNSKYDPQGALQERLHKIQTQHFPQLPPLKLVIGKLGKRGGQKSIRLASFWPSKGEVRVHPYMLDEGVPDAYITYLLFHELCHAQLMHSGQAKSGEHHGPDFYRLEDQCPDVEFCRSWEKDHLSHFLTGMIEGRVAEENS